MTSDEKKRFRSRKCWKEFRDRIRKERKIDELTHSKLSKTCEIHHLDPFHYDNLEDERAFACLNNRSHELIEFLTPYYMRDPEIIDRLRDILERERKYAQKASEDLIL